ncbi:DNA utilization protein GntX [Arsenophonus nasoniae]|uniref:DNA utilization protein GntX n=1 Tax=Arsenophonus nasoniae TaxID=638 RepID=UPI0038790EF9
MLTMVGYCWLCHQTLKYRLHGICRYCLKHLPYLRQVCHRCALPIEQLTLTCGRCLQTPPYWHNLVAITPYIPPLSKLIQQYKFKKIPQIAFILARLFLLYWQQGYRQQRWRKPDIIIAIPLHHGKHWQRGFNQASLMAKQLAYWLGCQYQINSITRTRATLPQTQLSAKKRIQNLSNAFRIKKTFQDCHIAVLDDVITTGTTMNEVAKLLISAGANSVQAWAICRTL